VHDRQAILRAARPGAAARGYESLRFADVAQASGVGVSSLQYSFRTRDDLVTEVLRTAVHDEFERLTVRAVSEPDPWRRVCVLIAEQIDTDDDKRREAWLLWLEFWRAAVRDPALQADYAALAQRWRDLMEETVRLGVDQGAFTTDAAPSDLAAALVALIDGVLVQVEVGDPAMRADRGITIAQSAAASLLGVHP
jgi:AcrR family transcriptional regulator